MINFIFCGTVKLFFKFWILTLLIIIIYRFALYFFFLAAHDRKGLGNSIDNSTWWLCTKNGHLIILLLANTLLFLSTIYVLIVHATPFSKILQPFYGLMNFIIESIQFLGFLLVEKRVEITKVVINPEDGTFAMKYVKALIFGIIVFLGYFVVVMSEGLAHFIEKYNESKEKRTQTSKKAEKTEGVTEKHEGAFLVGAMAFIEAAGQTISYVLKHK